MIKELIPVLIAALIMSLVGCGSIIGTVGSQQEQGSEGGESNETVGNADSEGGSSREGGDKIVIRSDGNVRLVRGLAETPEERHRTEDPPPEEEKESTAKGKGDPHESGNTKESYSAELTQYLEGIPELSNEQEDELINLLYQCVQKIPEYVDLFIENFPEEERWVVRIIAQDPGAFKRFMRMMIQESDPLYKTSIAIMYADKKLAEVCETETDEGQNSQEQENAYRRDS